MGKNKFGVNSNHNTDGSNQNMKMMMRKMCNYLAISLVLMALSILPIQSATAENLVINEKSD